MAKIASTHNCHRARALVSSDAAAFGNQWTDFSQKIDVFKRVVFRLNAKRFLDSILGLLGAMAISGFVDADCGIAPKNWRPEEPGWSSGWFC